MMTIKDSKQIRAEKQRLQKREAELKEKISASLSELAGNVRVRPHPPEPNGVLSDDGEEDSILISTLAYAGALLGRKAGVIIERKIRSLFSEEE
jgi:hypothetical protein